MFGVNQAEPSCFLKRTKNMYVPIGITNIFKQAHKSEIYDLCEAYLMYI